MPPNLARQLYIVVLLTPCFLVKFVTETYVRNALKCGEKESGAGNLGTTRGAMHELEKGLELIENKKFPSALGKILIFETTSCEFDIITSKRLIECKNINWSQISGGRLE